MDQGGAIRVLHVDDDSQFVDMAATFLERVSDRITVHTETSASGGLDHLSDRDVDCIVSDHDMPGQTGIEFLETVRDDDPELPFILFTGKGSEEVASAAISAGVTDYLQKEVGTDQFTVLAKRIENCVSKHRAERWLRRYQAYTDDILDAVDDVFFVHDRDGNLVRWNDSLEAVTGYPPDEIATMNGVDFVREADRERTAAVIEEVFETGHATLEVPLLTSDGETIPYEYSAVRVENPDGEPQLAGIGRDITGRVEREAERERTVEFLEGLHEVTTDPALDFEEKVTRLLAIGTEVLGLPYGHLTRIELDDADPGAGTQTVVQATGDHRLLRPGERSPLSESYCRQTLETDEVVAMHDVIEAGWEHDPAYETFDLGCYIGTRVDVAGEVHGTVFFADSTPREEPFSDAEAVFVRHVGRWVGYELERRD